MAMTYLNIEYFARKGRSQILRDYTEKQGYDGDQITSATFWRAFSHILDRNWSQALVDLDNMIPNFETSCAILAAQLYCHERAGRRDEELVAKLKTQLRVSRQTMSMEAASFLAKFYWFSDLRDAAREVLERDAIESDGTERLTGLLAAWELEETEDGTVEKDQARTAADLLDRSLRHSKSDPEVLVAKAQVHRCLGNFDVSLELLSEMCSHHPGYYAAVIENVWTLIGASQWTAAFDLIDRRSSDSEEVFLQLEGLIIKGLHAMVCAADNRSALETVRSIEGVISKHEGRSSPTWLRVVRLFGSVAGNDVNLLQAILCLSRSSLNAATAAYKPLWVVETAELCFYLARYTEAIELLESLPESSNPTISASRRIGLLAECYALNGNAEQAQRLADMLMDESSPSRESRTRLLYTKALLSLSKDPDVEQLADCVTKALQAPISEIPSSYQGEAFFVKVVLTRSLKLVKICVERAIGIQPLSIVDPPLRLLDILIQKLERYAAQITGHFELKQALAFCQMLARSFDASLDTLTDLACLNCTSPAIYLLQAKIYIENGRTGRSTSVDGPAIHRAESATRQAVECDLNVRRSFCCRMLECELKIEKGDCLTKEDLEDILRTALVMRSGQQQGTEEAFLIPYDLLSARLLLLKVHSELDEKAEAYKLLNEARSEASTVCDRLRIFLHEVGLAVVSGQLETLESLIKEARFVGHYRLLAEVRAVHMQYLTDGKKHAAVQSLLDITEREPCFQTWCILAQFLESIGEHRGAIEYFKKALETKPKDAQILIKVAQLSTSVHLYEEALDYYSKALRYTFRDLRLLLTVGLLCKDVGQLQQAERALKKAMSRIDGTSQAALRADIVVPLAEVYRLSGNEDSCLVALDEGIQQQVAFLDSLQTRMRFQSELVQQQRRKLACLLSTLGRKFQSRGQLEEAHALYKRAVSMHEDCLFSRRMLIELSLAKGDLEEATSCFEATPMSFEDRIELRLLESKILLHKGKYPEATWTLREILEAHPCCVEALITMIRLLHQEGRLVEAEEFLNKMEEESPSLCFCSGVYYRRQGNHLRALEFFAEAMQECRLRDDAVLEMVGLVLGLDDPAHLWNQTPSESDKQKRQNMARALLDEVQDKRDSNTRFAVLSCYTLMMSPSGIENAMTVLADLDERKPGDASILLASAVGHQMLRQSREAKEKLERIGKLSCQWTNMEEHEKASLLLALHYLGEGKLEKARALCQKTVHINKSNALAVGILANLAMREGDCDEAAKQHPVEAKIASLTSSHRIHSLVRCLIKADRFAEVFDVYQQAMDSAQQKSSLPKELLIKATDGIRN